MKWLNSAWAFTLYIGVMFVAYILAGIFPSLPYAIFSVQMTTGVVGYWMKRNARKRGEWERKRQRKCLRKLGGTNGYRGLELYDVIDSDNGEFELGLLFLPSASICPMPAKRLYRRFSD